MTETRDEWGIRYHLTGEVSWCEHKGDALAVAAAGRADLVTRRWTAGPVTTLPAPSPAGER